MNIHQIETPFLVLDYNRVRGNINRFNHRLAKSGIGLRPHGKTAKNIDIVKMSLDNQPGGITVSTLGEAEYYSRHGIMDIIYAVGIAPVKLDRVAHLIQDGTKLTILLDSEAQVNAASEKARLHQVTIPVCIEVDSDGHRSGLKPSDPEFLQIGQRIESNNELILGGVLTHAGGSYQSSSVDEIKIVAAKERDTALECVEILKQNDLPCPIVSIGSTPTAAFAENLNGVTEIRAGVYMFMDLVMAGLGICKVEDIAISVAASVIGHQKEKGWIITDAGWMALSRDRGTASQKIDQGYGMVCDAQGHPYPDLIVSATNQEHGIISGRLGSVIPWERFPVGTILRILPNHACATAAQFDRYYVVNNSPEINNLWERINGW